MRMPGQAVSRKMMLDKMWDGRFYGDERLVDTHIKNIRKKIKEAASIETVRGVGYRLQTPD
jgi:two-component system response regulator VanR